MSSSRNSADAVREPGSLARERHRLAHVLRALTLASVPVASGLIGLDSLANHHGDETYYLQVAADMTETGNYLVPTYHGRLILDRAPLFYWLIAASFRLFGLSLWAGRLPSLLAAGVTTALAYWFAWRVYGSERGAVYAALATASAVVVAWLSRLAVPDMAMTVAVFLAVAFYVLALDGHRHRLYLGLAGTAVGLAAMLKGHVGLVVAGVPLAVLICWADRGTPRALRWQEVVAPWLWGPALLLAGWWYVYLWTSPRLAVEFATRHHDTAQTLGAALVEFMFAEAVHQVEGGWRGLLMNVREYFFGSIVWFVPWTLYVAGGWFLGQRHLRSAWRSARRPTVALLTLALSILALFTFVILELRNARYLLPVAPAVGILAGYVGHRREANAARQRRIPVPVRIAGGLIVLWTLLFGAVVPTLLGTPLEGLCETLRRQLGPKDTVFVHRLGESGATFVTVRIGRRVGVFDEGMDPPALAARLSISEREPATGTYLLTRATTAEALRALDGDRFAVVAIGKAGAVAERYELFDRMALVRVDGTGVADDR